MRATYDPHADAAYVYLCEIGAGEAVEQVVVDRVGAGEIILDFNLDGVLLGIEIVGALALAPEALLDLAERL